MESFLVIKMRTNLKVLFVFISLLITKDEIRPGHECNDTNTPECIWMDLTNWWQDTEHSGALTSLNHPWLIISFGCSSCFFTAPFSLGYAAVLYVSALLSINVYTNVLSVHLNCSYRQNIVWKHHNHSLFFRFKLFIVSIMVLLNVFVPKGLYQILFLCLHSDILCSYNETFSHNQNTCLLFCIRIHRAFILTNIKKKALHKNNQFCLLLQQ